MVAHQASATGMESVPSAENPPWLRSLLSMYLTCYVKDPNNIPWVRDAAVRDLEENLREVHVDSLLAVLHGRTIQLSSAQVAKLRSMECVELPAMQVALDAIDAEDFVRRVGLCPGATAPGGMEQAVEHKYLRGFEKYLETLPTTDREHEPLEVGNSWWRSSLHSCLTRLVKQLTRNSRVQKEIERYCEDSVRDAHLACLVAVLRSRDIWLTWAQLGTLRSMAHADLPTMQDALEAANAEAIVRRAKFRSNLYARFLKRRRPSVKLD